MMRTRKKPGFQVIPNYDPYKDMPESLHMAKDLSFLTGKDGAASCGKGVSGASFFG